MRSLILGAACAALLTACGTPDVDTPPGNEKSTSQQPQQGDLPAPSVQAAPSKWPYSLLALRGNAGSAVRILVEGGGNPTVANVQPLDGSFCIQVELSAAPAHYKLTVRSQASDGRLSAPSIVEVDRANDARAPADAKLCDGTPVGN
jgi:hypothetical protein